MPIESTAYEPVTPALKQMLPSVALSVGPAEGLRLPVVSQWGSVGFLSVMEACYEVGPSEFDVSLKLAGNPLGKCTLSSADPQCTFRGGLAQHPIVAGHPAALWARKWAYSVGR
jgi:hypothetical protein